MRTIKSLTLIAFAAVAFVSCKKDGTDQLTGDVNELGQGAYLKLTKLNSGVIDFSNIPASNLSMNVDILGKSSDSIVTYVSTSKSADPATWRRVKATAVSGPSAVVTVSATQVATALGQNPVTIFTPGATFNLYNEVITKEKQKFSTVNTNSEFISNGNYSQGFNWVATVGCPFSQAPFTGQWTVLRDDWADFFNPETIPVTSPAANQVSFPGYPRSAPLPSPNASGEPAYGARTANTIVTVDVASGLATVAQQNVGTYFGSAAVVAVRGNGFVFACTQTIDLRLDVLNYFGGNYLANRFILKK